jgi:hypothetical protein
MIWRRLLVRSEGEKEKARRHKEFKEFVENKNMA